MIAVTGAAGKTGRAIVRALQQRGALVRALVHAETRLSAMRELGAAEATIGDLTDTDSLREAFTGTLTIYHICPNMRADELEIGERVIEAALAAGVERLVYHSVLHPQVEAMPHHWNKLRVEEQLIESGLRFTILQPAVYMQNIKQQWGSIVDDGVYEVPYAPEPRIAMVDLRDVAEVAAMALLDRGHDSAIYELCGTRTSTQIEVAQVLSKVAGRSVLVQKIDRAAWRRKAKESGLGEYAVDSLVAMFEHYERCGFSGNGTVLESLLGRPATSFEEVVRRWREKDEQTGRLARI